MAPSVTDRLDGRLHTRFRAALGSLVVIAVPIFAQGRPAECAADPRYSVLDFWVGRWEVYAGGQRVGTNLIEKELAGCAVIERWSGVQGDRGISLFYYSTSGRQWRQVWVTDMAARPFGTKEKRLVGLGPDGQVRFQGEIGPVDERGVTVLDRTTLTPLTNREVRQVIEQSRDGGSTWIIAFDAIYRPARRSGSFRDHERP